MRTLVWKGLGHRERIASTGIVFFFDPAITIAMLGPEGNGGIVVCCCFESYFVDTVGGEAAFDFGEEHGAYVVAPELRQDVNGDDVAAFVATGADAKAGDLLFGRARASDFDLSLGLGFSFGFRDQAV